MSHLYFPKKEMTVYILTCWLVYLAISADAIEMHYTNKKHVWPKEKSNIGIFLTEMVQYHIQVMLYRMNATFRKTVIVLGKSVFWSNSVTQGHIKDPDPQKRMI